MSSSSPSVTATPAPPHKPTACDRSGFRQGHMQFASCGSQLLLEKRSHGGPAPPSLDLPAALAGTAGSEVRHTGALHNRDNSSSLFSNIDSHCFVGRSDSPCPAWPVGLLMCRSREAEGGRGRVDVGGWRPGGLWQVFGHGRGGGTSQHLSCGMPQDRQTPQPWELKSSTISRSTSKKGRFPNPRCQACG